MNLHRLAIFREVAQRRHFSDAAEALHYAQSTVSAQVRVLEAELGVRLFDRLGPRVVLTEAGRRLLPYAERLLSLADKARKRCRSMTMPPAASA